MEAGRVYEKSSDVGSLDLAIEAWRKGCDLENSTACTELGKLYLEGDKVARNLAKAFNFLERGCLSGDAWACGAVGDFYRSGTETEKNLKTARARYERGCELAPTEHEACTEYANVLHEGEGGAKNLAKAFTLAKRACEGDMRPCAKTRCATPS